jgi:hypothetical protein
VILAALDAGSAPPQLALAVETDGREQALGVADEAMHSEAGQMAVNVVRGPQGVG